MKKVLIVVDMQNDFIDGALGTKEAQAIVGKVIEKIKSYPPDAVYATMDTHFADYLKTQEGRRLPVEHCISGSDGWLIRKEIYDLLDRGTICIKNTFGSLALPEALKKQEDLEEVELVGLCTDICVVSNALLIKAALPEVKVSVDASCCAGVTPARHLAALETMRSCQVEVIGADEAAELAAKPEPLKLSVIYDTRTGNTAQAAEWIAEGMRRTGAEVRCFKIDAVDEDFVRASAGTVIGCPVYIAQMTADLHKWLQDRGAKLGLGGKLGGAFATQQYTHGGAELVIQSLLEMELTLGMTVYSAGGSQGKPCIHIGPVAVNNNIEAHNSIGNYRANFEIYGERFAKKAAAISG